MFSSFYLCLGKALAKCFKHFIGLCKTLKENFYSFETFRNENFKWDFVFLKTLFLYSFKYSSFLFCLGMFCSYSLIYFLFALKINIILINLQINILWNKDVGYCRKVVLLCTCHIYCYKTHGLSGEEMILMCTSLSVNYSTDGCYI
jgi:hypothetical protein